MITSFLDPETEKFFNRQRSKKINPNIESAARRKLVLLDSARSLSDISGLPGNRFEKIEHGRFAGFLSIRINDQYRICFHWSNPNAEDVTITDYH